MAFFPANSGMGGVGFPNYTDVLKNGFSISESYTATKNCYVVGYMVYTANTSGGTAISVDGTIVASIHSTSVTSTISVCVPVEKDSVVHTNPNGNYTNIKIVGMK